VSTRTVEVVPIEGLPDIQPGDDLAGLVANAARHLGLRPGDVVVVTQKVVSKAEGRVVEDGDRPRWVGREARRVVARRGELVIAQTAHGFVCANAGVDASNVAEGFLTLLPEDPDASAERLRTELSTAAGGPVGVVVTDTFGRPWRRGLVNVAIGCAGLPALVDLRGTKDHTGRVLEATVVALADEVAGASGLVMGKADRVPAAIVRGLRVGGDAGAAHHTRPWLFVVLESDASKRRLLAAMAQAWVEDLRGDGTAEHVIARRLRKSDALLGRAPILIVPAVRMRGAHSYRDHERASAEHEMFLLSGGAAIQNLLLALHAQVVASCWVSSTLFCKEETREALGLDDEWIPLGSVAAGPMPAEAPPSRPPLPVEEHVRFE
jgi:coenzyme F420-0:L-glutamate ligase/coenzyme F420-1:gamma-L-glutamate ligase